MPNQPRRRRCPGISGKMFSAPGVLARVEPSAGRVRWQPKRSSKARSRRAAPRSRRYSPSCAMTPVQRLRLLPACYPTPGRGTHPPRAAEPLERLYADLELSGREDLNLRPFGPESGPGPSQGEPTDAKPARSLQTEGGAESSHSQGLGGFPKNFSTRFLPNSSATRAHGGAEEGGVGAKGQCAAKGPPART